MPKLPSWTKIRPLLKKGHTLLITNKDGTMIAVSKTGIRRLKEGLHEDW